MKQAIQRLSLLLIALVASVATFAYDACIDGIYYNLNSSAKTASVASGDNEYTDTITIPETVTYDDVTYSVTSIGVGTFYDCSSLTSVIIPNSVMSIGNYAFEYCSGLASIEIPNSVTSIGQSAFHGCSGLTSIEIPNSVRSIGQSTFTSCTSLTSVEIPNSVTSIGSYAFHECSGLTSVTIPKSVTSIGRWAFSGCDGLTSVTNLASTPQTIYNNVFATFGTLHVISGYKEAYATANVWKNFTIVDDVPPMCEAPEIEYVNGKISVTSATEGAVCHTKFGYDGTDNVISLNNTITVTSYATCEGYADSETVTKEITLSSGGGSADVNEDGTVDISDVNKVISVICGGE